MRKNNFNRENNRYVDSTYLVKCVNEHIFDYRERERISGEDLKHYAPCQGKCPECGTTVFSFLGQGINIYPVMHCSVIVAYKRSKE